MKKIKLTDKTQRVLKAMQEGARVYFHPYIGRFNPRAYYNCERIGTCTREIKKLIKEGLVSEKRKTHSTWDILITDAGKEFECELPEPDDIWSVERAFRAVTVHKYKGFLKGSTFSNADGGTSRATDERSFYTDRESAFKRAISWQKNLLESAKRAVKTEERELERLEEHMQNPEKDKPGYL